MWIQKLHTAHGASLFDTETAGEVESWTEPWLCIAGLAAGLKAEPGLSVLET